MPFNQSVPYPGWPRIRARSAVAASAICISLSLLSPQTSYAATDQALQTAIADYENEAFEKAKPVLEKAAASGSAEANYRLGMMKRFAWGIDKDFAAALEHFSTAAKAGHAEAQSELAKMYKDGRGTERDAKRASELFMQAALQSVGVAQLNLARMYRSGKGVEKSAAKAWAMFSLAIGNQYMDAMGHRGRLEAKMTDSDKAEGKQWLDTWRQQIQANK